MEQPTTVTLDPPWPENGGGGRGAGNHYATVPYHLIPEVILGAPCWPRGASSLWVGMWTTVSSKPYAMDILRHALGCRPVTEWTWLKEDSQGELVAGMGQYGRHGAEFVLWGKRGTVGRAEDSEHTSVRAVFSAPVGRHSQKPSLFYENVRRVFPGPYLAMFERTQRPGFAVWGDEVPA